MLSIWLGPPSFSGRSVGDLNWVCIRARDQIMHKFFYGPTFCWMGSPKLHGKVKLVNYYVLLLVVELKIPKIEIQQRLASKLRWWHRTLFKLRLLLFDLGCNFREFDSISLTKLNLNGVWLLCAAVTWWELFWWTASKLKPNCFFLYCRNKILITIWKPGDGFWIVHSGQ